MRNDGIRVREEDAMYYLIPHFLTRRYDAMNMVTVHIPEEPLRKYMNEKRKEGRRISHMALVLTAYLRCVKEFPSLNRFIGNKTIYQHKDFTAALVVLRPGGGETMAKLELEPGEDVFSVQDKIDRFLEDSRDSGKENGLDKTMAKLCQLSWLMSFLIGILRFLDRHGLLPRFLVKVSPFHASLLISNLASIRTNHIYHHVYEFGTTSVAITMGNMVEVPRRTRDGIVHDRCIPMGIVMDERIASGVYFASVFARFRQLLAKPELLEKPWEEQERAQEQASDNLVTV